MNKKNLLLRIISSLIMAPIVILAVYFGDVYLFVLLVIVSSLAMLEFKQFIEKKGNSSTIFALIFANFCIVYSFYINRFDMLVIILIFFVLLIQIVNLFSNTADTFERISYQIFALFYISCSLGCLLYLREEADHFFQFSNDQNAYFILLSLVTIWLTDIFAFFGGSLLGKNKLYEAVSPNKTIEGSLIGFIVGVAVSSFLFAYFFPELGLLIILQLTSLISISTQIGDLFESKLKRDVGVKDSGNIIPGHGGVLDRVDSILFVFPILFLFLQFKI